MSSKTPKPKKTSAKQSAAKKIKKEGGGAIVKAKKKPLNKTKKTNQKKPVKPLDKKTILKPIIKKDRGEKKAKQAIKKTARAVKRPPSTLTNDFTASTAANKKISKEIAKKEITGNTIKTVPTHIAEQEPQETMNKEPTLPQSSTTLSGKAATATSVVGSLNFSPYQPKPDEKYMSPQQLKHFENILLEWKNRLMQEVDTTVVHMKEDASVLPDPVDRASKEQDFTLELRTRDRERKLIKKIEQALDLIKNQEYGYCEDCGAEIGIRRLEARPTAERCIDCKTIQEIREKQTGAS